MQYDSLWMFVQCFNHPQKLIDKFKRIMKSLKILISLAITLVLLLSCSDSNNTTGPDSNINEASDQKQFVWESMNYWYLYQDEVPELADDKSFFSDEQAFQDFLIGFDDAEALFNTLIFEDDEFSFFIENFEEFTFGDFVSMTNERPGFGFEFGLVQFSGSNNVFGYVQFVQADTPADDAGLERGNLFTEVNGTQLTVNNFRSVLDADSYELTLAEIENNSVVPTGETASIEKTPIVDDPIFLSKVIEAGNSNVGYLMYNSFQSNSHEELNTIFSDFEAQGIDEMVIDLRYNGGGALLTSTAISTMISGLGNSEIFAALRFNEKRSAQNDTIRFMDELPLFNDDGDRTSTTSINKLSSLDRVFVLTGRQTASASEALINGLLPFMDVVIVGLQTVGKDEGSITLYDAPVPFTNRDLANPDHKIALQPIVFKDVNADGQGFGDGFIPDFEVNELDALSDLPPLGDPEDPLLGRALERIEATQVMVKSRPLTSPDVRWISSSQFLQQPRANRGMYLLPSEANEMLNPEK